MKQKILLFVVLFVCAYVLTAQNTMRVSFKNGTSVDFPIEQLDSITFIDVEDEPSQKVTLVGTWYWENVEQGYSETLTFNSDGSFTCVDHYFGYGFDSSTYGTYMFFGSMLNLRSNGYGYNRFYQWMVTELTETRLTVLTPMGSYTYSRQNKN